jgi:hypothetical protein
METTIKSKAFEVKQLDYFTGGLWLYILSYNRKYN